MGSHIIFTTGLTKMGLQEWDRTFFGIKGDQKIKVGRIYKWDDCNFNQCVNLFQDDLVKLGSRKLHFPKSD